MFRLRISYICQAAVESDLHMHLSKPALAKQIKCQSVYTHTHTHIDNVVTVRGITDRTDTITMCVYMCVRVCACAGAGVCVCVCIISAMNKSQAGSTVEISDGPAGGVRFWHNDG